MLGRRGDVPDLFALEKRRRGSSDVARLHSVPPRRREVDLDLHLRNALLKLDDRVGDAVDLGDDVPDQVRLLPKDLQVRAEDPYDDRLALPARTSSIRSFKYVWMSWKMPG